MKELYMWVFLRTVHMFKLPRKVSFILREIQLAEEEQNGIVAMVKLLRHAQTKDKLLYLLKGVRLYILNLMICLEH